MIKANKAKAAKMAKRSAPEPQQPAPTKRRCPAAATVASAPRPILFFVDGVTGKLVERLDTALLHADVFVRGTVLCDEAAKPDDWASKWPPQGSGPYPYSKWRSHCAAELRQLCAQHPRRPIFVAGYSFGARGVCYVLKDLEGSTLPGNLKGVVLLSLPIKGSPENAGSAAEHDHAKDWRLAAGELPPALPKLVVVGENAQLRLRLKWQREHVVARVRGAVEIEEVADSKETFAGQEGAVVDAIHRFMGRQSA